MEYALSEIKLVKGDHKATKKLLENAQKALASNTYVGGIAPETAREIKNISDAGLGTVRRGGIESINDLLRGPGATASPQLAKDMLKGTGTPGSVLLGSSGKIPFTDINLPKWLGGNKPREVLATPTASLADIIKNIRNKKYGLAGTQVGSSAVRQFNTGGNFFRDAGMGMGRFGRIAPRAAVYAGLPLLQAYVGASRAPGQREKRIMELVRSLSK